MFNVLFGIAIGLIASIIIKKGETEIVKAIPTTRVNHYQKMIDELDAMIAMASETAQKNADDMHSFNEAMRKDYTQE